LLINPEAPRVSVLTLPEALERSASTGAHVWIADKDGEPAEVTTRAILERGSQLARNLLARGLTRGERVVVMLPTSEDWLVAFFGTLLAGAIAVPVGPNLAFGGMDRYATTVRAILDDAGARFLIANGAIEPWTSALGGVEIVRVDLLEAAPGHPLPSPSPEDPAVIQYTSGTTGAPKGVVLSHRALLTNAFMIGERAQMSTRDVGVSWLPLFHDMGLVGALLTALSFHYPLLMMPVESFLLHPRRWLQWIGRKRGTLSVAPNFAYQLAVDRIAPRHLEGIDLSSWRHAFNGAEAVRPSTLTSFAERFSAHGFDGSAFQPVYGMAENSLAATFPAAGTRYVIRDEIVSVGTPLSGVSVKTVDGQILIKSPSLMDGYFRNDAATAEVLVDGWLKTGDLGFIRDGELHVTGRAKELIIKRGRNYPPDDFERIAVDVGRGRVLRAAAFGVANKKSGTEDVVVVLETRALTVHERELLTREVSSAINAELSIGPDVTVVVPPRTIERTTSGKLRRGALRNRYLDGALPAHSS
jgi:acyl-CoA synthetase (AMP-forming)/AMP-acid ligase II